MDWSLIAAAGPAVNVTFTFVEVWMRINGASESARTFKRLVDQVKNDLSYAQNYRVQVGHLLDKQDHKYRAWINASITETMDALAHIGRFVVGENDLSLADRGAASFEARVRHIITDEPALIAQERALSYVHAALLAGINAMHLLESQETATRAIIASLTKK